MSLRDQINDDLKAAMRSGETVRRDTIRLLTAALKQREVDERKTLTDGDVLAVIEKMIKQRRDSISQFEQGGRQDLADKEEQELTLLQTYMPQAMGEDELAAAIADFLALYPQLKIDLNASEGALNLVDARIDLAIRISAEPDPMLIGRVLAPCTSVLVASPAYLAWTVSGELIVMVVLGGMGTVLGPLVGALTLLGCEELLKGMTEHWPIILGPLIVLVVLLARRGLYGLALDWDACHVQAKEQP